MLPAHEPLATAAPALMARGPSCVLDPRLVLSPLGLVTAARLAGECPVWLPRELRETLRSPQAYRVHPDKLAPRLYGGHLRELAPPDEDIREALGHWSAALQGWWGPVRVFHLDEHPGQSRLPASVDGGLHERFERLAAGLDRAVRQARYDLPRGEAIAACFRDTAALAAALAPYGAVILTVMEADGLGLPAVCNYLDAWGLRVLDVTDQAGDDAQALRALLARAGLGPVAWAGLAFAAVHVVSPSLGLEVTDERGALALWQRTRVFWHRL